MSVRQRVENTASRIVASDVPRGTLLRAALAALAVAVVLMVLSQSANAFKSTPVDRWV